MELTLDEKMLKILMERSYNMGYRKGVFAGAMAMGTGMFIGMIHSHLKREDTKFVK